MENLFEPILDKNEKIEKVFKPNKTKMFWSAQLVGLFGWFWIALSLATSLAFVFGNAQFDSNENIVSINTSNAVLGGILTFVGVAIICILIIHLFTRISYKNTYFAYSNKRVIIRRGIFGIDYKSLDMSMIGAVTVSVSLLDKLLRKNTGTIVFGSMASPMASNNALSFKYANITDPYNSYKEIKNFIDDYKSIKPEQNK